MFKIGICLCSIAAEAHTNFERDDESLSSEFIELKWFVFTVSWLIFSVTCLAYIVAGW